RMERGELARFAIRSGQALGANGATTRVAPAPGSVGGRRSRAPLHEFGLRRNAASVHRQVGGYLAAHVLSLSEPSCRNHPPGKSGKLKKSSACPDRETNASCAGREPSTGGVMAAGPPRGRGYGGACRLRTGAPEAKPRIPGVAGRILE